MTGSETSSAWPSEFGVNEWMLDELYDKFVEDRHSVDRAWWPLLEAHADQSKPALSAPHEMATGTAATRTADEPSGSDGDTRVEQIRGVARSLVSSMEASRQIPTATSVRTMPAKLLIDNRLEINEHRVRIRRSKVGFTHLIGWAIVQAVKRYPAQNVHYEELDGKPSVATPPHLNLGIAVDVARPDGARTLLVPNIKAADSMGFADFVGAYDDIVHRARSGALTVVDFAGTTLSLTNPGGIGTQHSVPRLMPGQGCIIGAGALEYPAAFQGADAELLADLAVGKTITLTSTYDHRVIQGAGSGEFLGIIEDLLLGRHHFYEDIFTALRIPYAPIRWARDLETGPDGGADKATRIQELIHAYRVRGHRVADVDPLEYRQKSRRDLDIAGHGLTLWDLDREFTAGLLAGERRRIPLRGILGVLRDSYCRTVGIEYMHIQDPAQREWIQRRVESPIEEPSHGQVLRILGKLNEAEAFETFLQTKYVGQTRFSLEGGESTIALLDAVVSAAARAGLEEVAIAMAHRGRLNVLANIAGKTYGQIFHEFEGSEDPLAGEGSGDVKYHLGTEGTYRGAAGESIAVTVAANPSHLDAVDGVLEGIVRAKQDRHPIGSFPVLPIIVHGDAAMAGQGIVAETLQMSQLRGYRTGGSIRVTINNQVGFTTLPTDARSSIYSTDVAKAVQAPIFHVNGDDPEAVVRVAELAFAYRQEFHRDVVIDLICYRRRGHNEGDDPSMTQPRMYSVIGTKESVRRLYSEAALDRGAITEAEYEATQRDFQERLEAAFAEMRKPPAAAAESMADGDRLSLVQEPVDTGAPLDRIARVGSVFASPPEGFTVHPKLQQLLIKREEMSRDGKIDWAFGELLAVGTLLMEGVPVRFAGQDSRRGTFAQRHAVLHDYQDGREWSPLGDLSEDQGRFWIYDSLLSEYAAMGFEYGYSVENSDALVLWEAQFGDFVNGAQIVVDEFVSSAEQKWGQPSSLVLLLPHGYEGRGPDHSSGRIERFLQLCAQQNMTVACPSTPASYFHLLRRQARTRPRKPLVVFTPKSMLRTKAATSDVHEFVSGRFEPVIDDASVREPGRVERVVLVAGKLYYELRAALTRSPDPRIALVRVERFFPLPADELAVTLARYPGAEVVWAQEEPRNQGAWSYLLTETTAIGFSSSLRLISRPPSASPATGSAARHQEEQQKLVSRVLDVDDANGAGGARR
ncbi:multifunctional oxoglutarate decarboxylase/oxoglutarate dehydrogenase thiamine pyrophosphate-binding subunit/dihydrolipoyllysine-residue succinyltransferase subunit [Pseudonocardia yunnanensis]|uniref:Multifunctional oxoglutarate decarboxylase/oxoglutarate dehydrogenase thiamine pyrophosphate-binding subunit/dihydrolipoyllysine-residue succinyltransferase subunit n=1 Tax=Pseudonocardia yunnanensis TaxID=58107 RepID=A0ABW4ERY1_9PSEU